jgi:MFS family permease
MILTAIGFGLLMLLPADFSFPIFGTVIFVIGVGMGLFASPNTAAIMNSVPARHRGVASIRVTFNNVGMPLSILVGFLILLLVIGAMMMTFLDYVEGVLHILAPGS